MSSNNKKDKIEKIIDDAFKKAEKELNKKDVDIGATFSHEGKEIGIPQALMDLVMALNPKDDKKRNDITNQLFKDKQ